MVSSIVMYGYENWAKKKADCWRTDACFWVVVLGKTLENPLDCKEIKPVNSKGNQSWIFIERTDGRAEAPILWPLHVKSQLTGKDWFWERLKVKEGGGRGWDSYIASLTQWIWIWANSRIQWKTEESSMLQPMGFQRVGHDLATEQQQQQRLFIVEPTPSASKPGSLTLLKCSFCNIF